MGNELKFIAIKNSYAIPKMGELSIDEKALLEYEKFCLELMNQAEKQKEVIDKAIEYINQHWVIDEPVWFKNDLLDILKEVSK